MCTCIVYYYKLYFQLKALHLSSGSGRPAIFIDGEATASTICILKFEIGGINVKLFIFKKKSTLVSYTWKTSQASQACL